MPLPKFLEKPNGKGQLAYFRLPGHQGGPEIIICGGMPCSIDSASFCLELQGVQFVRYATFLPGLFRHDCDLHVVSSACISRNSTEGKEVSGGRFCLCRTEQQHSRVRSLNIAVMPVLPVCRPSLSLLELDWNLLVDGEPWSNRPKFDELQNWAAAAGWGCTRFDYRGHGLSSGSMKTFTLGDW